jgi:hypothetical protein
LFASPNVTVVLLRDAVVGVERVIVTPDTAMTPVPGAMPVPNTHFPTVIPVAEATVRNVLPLLAVPVVVWVIVAPELTVESSQFSPEM